MSIILILFIITLLLKKVFLSFILGLEIALTLILINMIYFLSSFPLFLIYLTLIVIEGVIGLSILIPNIKKSNKGIYIIGLKKF